ncbi:MAG TPA: hypothetical protein EYG03_22690 [Planctomycetes bacterium]|nr:hypothetical protein [Fuerstiella sp.]HIK94763.1 hypothetical protein [Planctomycetota bacterium]
MSIERAEQLKSELTDKWVVVAPSLPELRRFSALTGKVKTVNMNGQALVEFDGPVDISWYDINPEFLTVVDGPRPKAKVAEKAKPAAKKSAAASPASKPAAGGSPLDKIRAAGGGAAKPAPAAGGSPLDKIRAQAGGAAKPAGGSPLDQIRSQAAGATKDAPAEEAAAAPAAAPAEETKPEPKAAAAKAAPTGDPLDIIRAQGAFKG